MDGGRAPARATQEAILHTVVELVEALARGWDRGSSGQITSHTLLVGEVGFTSMDLVLLVVEIQQHYRRHDLPWEDLFAPDGHYGADVRPIEIASFLARHLIGQEP